MAGRRGGEKLPEFSPKDEILARGLASGLSQAKAAEAAGVTDRTVRNKLQKPEFRALVAKYQKQFISEAWGVMASGIKPMVRKLARLARNEDPKIQLAAAKAFGALFIRMGVFHAHDERLTALEEAAENRGDV